MITTGLGPTARVAPPLLAWNPLSPAKAVLTPLFSPGLYVPAFIPVRLTFGSVATPEEFVVALPTEVPFNVKLIDFPLTPEPPDVSVAVRLTVAPYVPLAAATDRLVAAAVLADLNVNVADALLLPALQAPAPPLQMRTVHV
jgi:hypothetical protein